VPTFRLPTPADFHFARDACSYGYFLLAPNHWSVHDRAFTRTFSLPGGAAAVRITQPRGTPLLIFSSRSLGGPGRAGLTALVRRMFRLDEDEATIRAFHRLDPRWRRSGRGRLFRSPTLFEDVVKTVTSCNVTWPNTVHMNRRLCDVLGEPPPPGAPLEAGHAFPDAARLARARPQTLRARCRVGYRDRRLIELARLLDPARRGALDQAWFEDPATPDQQVYDALIELTGIGPYAAANIMQLLGRYSRLPLDTEGVRYGRTVLGYAGSPAQVMRQVQAHFQPFGAHAFRSYWFEMWRFYEAKHGPAHTWERDSTGRLFTAALLSK
jgi:3-methyladenine DNA glycosylase/8-oxoguanine DNA glycosylase